MATIKKLKICGIRSFGCNEGDEQTVRFQKPLTLILGENGCGKSTIIECLRFITAHKEPPGKSTFVHDPSLTNSSVVRGSVTLMMTDSQDNVIHLCRQLQATKTKKGISTKSLDNVITTVDKKTKERISISNRCADIASETARLFGISKAILENVIFCTQEDSHWPLDTDQKLKEKFDQIFDSDKYNKAINKVREKKKNLHGSEKESVAELKHLKQTKIAANEKRTHLKNIKQQVSDSKKSLGELEDKVGPLEAKLRDVYKKEMELSKTQTMKETKKEQLRGVELHVIDLKSRLKTEFKGSDEELKRSIQNFSKEQSNRAEEIDRLANEIRSLNKNAAEAQDKLMYEQSKLGQLQKEEELHKEKVSERNKKLHQLAAGLGMESSQTSQLTEDSVTVLMNQALRKTNQKNVEVKSLREKLDNTEREVQAEVDRCREQYSGHVNTETNKVAQLKATQQEMKRVSNEIAEVDDSAGKLARLSSVLTKTSKELEEVKCLVNPEDLKKQLNDLKKERGTAEEELGVIEETVSVLQQQATLAAELDLQTEQRNAKLMEFNRLKKKHEEGLTTLLGSVPERGFKDAVQASGDRLRRRIKELTAEQGRKEKELTQVEMKRKHLREQLKSKEDLERSMEEELFDQCGGEDLDETTQLVKSELTELQGVNGILSSSDFIYKKYIKTLSSAKPSCPVCHRDFNAAREAETLVAELNSKIEELPNRLADTSLQLQTKETRYRTLLMLKPTQEKLSVIRNVEKPKIRTELDSVDSLVTTFRADLTRISTELSGPISQEVLCNRIQGDMSLLDRLQIDMKYLEQEIDQVKLKMPQTNLGGMSLQSAMNEQEKLRSKLRTTTVKMMEKQEALNKHNEQVQILQARKNSLMEEMVKIEGGVGQRKQLEDRFAELQGEEIVLMEEVDAAREVVVAARQRVDELNRQKEELKKSNEDVMEAARQELMTLQRQLDEVKNLQGAIAVFQDKGVAQKIQTVLTAIKKWEVMKIDVREKQEAIQKSLESVQKDQNMQQVRERELADNLKLREKRRDAEKLKEEIKELEESFGNLDYDNLIKIKRKLKAEEEQIAKEKNLIQGRVGELEAQVETVQKELEGRLFKDIDVRYRKELIRSKVLFEVQNDLMRYAQAMEYAMLTYHKQQMSKVNAFIREYWRKIYQGNDIDYIEIQAEEMMSGEKKRVYHYRVVEIKGNTILEMRNRCSAGQKMLASLIIRMALSETFSSNCGILTLDEPTTNLDSSNKKYLARTLSEIVATKQRLGMSYTTFQLVVITHDEEFVRELFEVDAISEYVRVERDHRGKSRVSMQPCEGGVPEMNLRRGPQHIFEYD